MPGSRRSGFFTPVVTSVAALAVLGGLAVQPDLLGRGADADPASDSYDWNVDTAAEQLRQDQCLMADVLRLGGPSMATTAQDGLNQPADKLHTLADRKSWEKTPLAAAYQTDRDAAGKELDALHALRDGWRKPLEGLTNPAGFTETDFHWPPGSPGDGKEDFYGQTGLTKWTADRFWKNDGDFYADSTPRADAATLKAVDDLGSPLYGKDPDPAGLPADEWNRALAERDAFKWLHGAPGENAGADNARMFLASGGFPRTAPQPGTAEYRIAVEDLKSRFAACAWRDPIDPDHVLGDVSGTAATEWQQEIASQTTQRNQILNASKDATKSLAAGAKALGDLLGYSWTADHLARWQDYWSAGGAGWVGDAPAVIEVHAAQGKCLDVEGAKKDNGTPVQLYTCNGSAAQEWKVYGDDRGLHLQNVNSLKCLDVSNNNPANGTKIQIWTCSGSPAQTWEFNLRATGSLRNVGTDKCLDLHEYTNGYNSWLYTCNGSGPQQFDVTPSGHTGTVPPKAQFDKAKAGITAAQTAAKKQLDVLKTQLAAVKKAATASDTAEQASYTVADTSGAPRGRGLLVGQQKAQVTQGAAAALEAMVKAGETAEAATRASGGDSQTIAERALAQAAQVKAEFRKKAAEKAELQAKAAADAAKVHRDNAKKDKETAEAKLTEAVKAEADAKAAAADAHAKRLAAEAEEKTAKAEKETAAAKRAEAAEHKKNAESEATKAKDAKGKAEAAEKTAGDRRDDAVKASGHAKAMRDDAWDAEQKANAARAKADAKEAYADSLDSGDAANAARAAANDADKAADDAETAAGRARSEADAATQAAADADAAATRAEAAAKRARSDADAAQADKLKADAAVRTATSAVADAIKASQDASAEAKTAVKLANEAQQHAKDSKTQANAANTEAGKALAASAKAAGYAHVTAQAAVDAGQAAQQVANPANDAIQLGSAYVDTDSTAGLVVLTGQASKTIAGQQQAVADAHAKNAAAEAQAAKNLADQAKGDAKEAYQHAANAAQYAANARTYSKEALGYAADAATAASKAAASLTRTVAYDQQATDDAAAADKAAGNAEGYAKDARDSADAAELDAAAARSAASQAEQDAKDARSAANRADAAATEAEQAAKDADKYAKEAQDAADRTEREKNGKRISDGAASGIGSVFWDEKREPIGEPEILDKKNCNPIVHFGDCVITAKIHFNVKLDIYLCTMAEIPVTGCPHSEALFLKTQVIPNQYDSVTRTISEVEFNKGIDPVDILLGDFIGCGEKLTGNGGSLGDCDWAAFDIATLFDRKIIKVAADAVKALDAAVKTRIGVLDAWRGLKVAELEADAVAGVSRAELNKLDPGCPTNSFPPGTPVLLANGTSKPISSISEGDELLATDPNADITRSAQVTATFSHRADRLVQITLAGGGRVLTTPGHQLYVAGRGWVPASDLHAKDRLRAATGAMVAVVGIRAVAAPRKVFDLTVSGLHTFYVKAGATSVLVHNCGDRWTSHGSLRDHFIDHGAEVGAQSEREYEAGAAFLACDCDPADPSILRRFDSVTQTATYFDNATGEIAVKSKKGLVTYFKPDRGVDYFNDPTRVQGTVVPPGTPIPWK
ncbi:RICIN domain-containing protein [Streptomyces sp. AK02-04a]|uniref:RICIN domain-containing protein n=1 Tax=Streptomyces sp. AK02-04a TaxID=3028649 RepID=UPI0029B5651C|nr:RICIN domain-containing protein [Streptomyces sp. AK02-04a]MDX3763806.1 RICIN domain-containing protein [Streptomyces sp. AK02-04a]